MKRRSFTNLKKEMSLEQLNNFCKELAEEYATSDYEFARKFFCEKYSLTQSCYYKVLEYAVVNNLISDLTLADIMHKSATNQSTYYDGSGATSVAKYNRLYNKRCENIAAAFSEEKIRDIADDFLLKSKYRVSIKHEISTKTVDFAIMRAVSENIVDDRTVAALESRSIATAKGSDKYTTRVGFEIVKAMREEKK